METELNEKEFFNFRDLIAKRSGIHFGSGKHEILRDNLLRRMEVCGLTTFSDYFQLITSSEGTKELESLLSGLTIPETYFFRDKAQFQVLDQYVIPEILEEKSYPGASLRIWSAGCSSGEEPYTIAMILAAKMEGGEYYPPIQILATDLSHAGLETARRGAYGVRSVLEVPKDYLYRFFKQEGDTYFLDETIKRMVEFRHFNLVTESYPQEEMSGWDIIFCRNVTIYFEPDSTKKVIHNFYRSLRQGGYLFAGFSENLLYLSDEFATVQLGGTFLYKKEASRKKHKRKAGKVNRRRYRSGKATSRRPRGHGSVTDQKAEKIQQACSGAKRLLDWGQPQEAGDLLAPYLGEETSAPESVVLLGAEIALNQGKLEEALQLFDRIIQREPLSAAGHYLLGIVYRTKGEEGKAIEEFKKVLYFEPEHALARFNLGDLYYQVGQLEAARLEYAAAVRLLKEVPESFDERFAGGFSPTILADTCVSKLKGLNDGEKEVKLNSPAGGEGVGT